jgi:multicomponent Na+:H+ antiporter subunit G
VSDILVIAALGLAGFGVLMVLLAAVGLVRFPDVYTRSHAAGKAATLGVCCVMLGAALGLGGWGALWRALLAVVFLFVTIPVGAQLIARAALRNGAPPSPDTRLDSALHQSGCCGLPPTKPEAGRED